jgi:hypothetical protein
MDTQYYRYNRFCKITEENTGQRRTKRINDSQGEGVPSPKLHNN